MAIKQGGAGGGSNVPSRTLHDEEEERRRKAEREAAHRAAMAKNVPAAIEIAERRGLITPSQPIFRSSSSPSNELFRSKQLQTQFARQEKESRPLADYMTLAKKYGGEEKLAQRVQGVKFLWDTYMKPFRGGEAIWEMANSEFTLSQLEDMAKAGHLAMFAPRRGDPRRKLDLSAVEQKELSDRETLQYLGFYAENPLAGIEATIDRPGTSANPLDVLGQLSDFAYGVGRESAQYVKDNPIEAALLALMFVPGLQGGSLAARVLIGITGTSKALKVVNTGITSAKVLGGIMGGSVATKRVLDEQMKETIKEKTAEAEELQIATEEELEEFVAAYKRGEATDLLGRHAVEQLGSLALQTRMKGELDDYVIIMDAIGKAVYGGDKDDVAAAQKLVQTDILDPLTGRVIFEGKLKDLEPTGLFDPEWMQAIMSRASDVKRANIDRQIWMLENEFIEADAEITGDMNSDPRWREAEQAVRAKRNRQLAMGVWFPERMMYEDTRSLPTGKADWKQTITHIGRNGPLGWLPAGVVTIFDTIGGMHNANIASAEFRLRSEEDPAYSAAVNQLEEYVIQKYMDVGGEFGPYLIYDHEDPALRVVEKTWDANDQASLNQVVSTIRMNIMSAQLAQRSGTQLTERQQKLIADKQLLELVLGVSKEASRLLSGPEGFFSADYISAFCHAFDVKQDEYVAWRNDHPMEAEIYNTIIDFSSSFVGLGAVRLMKGGTLARNYTSAMTNQEFLAEVDTAFRYLEKGQVSKAARIFGPGPDANALIQDALHVYRGATNPQSARYTSKADELLRLAKDGDSDGIAAALPRMDKAEADELAKILINEAARDATKPARTLTDEVADWLKVQKSRSSREPSVTVKTDSATAVNGMRAALSRAAGDAVKVDDSTLRQIAEDAARVMASDGEKAAKELVGRRVRSILPEDIAAERVTGLQPTRIGVPAPTIIDDVAKIALSGDEQALMMKLAELRVADPRSMASEIKFAVSKADDPNAAVRKFLGDIDVHASQQAQPPVSPRTAGRIVETPGEPALRTVKGKSEDAIVSEVWESIRGILPKTIEVGAGKARKKAIPPEQIAREARVLALQIESRAELVVRETLHRMGIAYTDEIGEQLIGLQTGLAASKSKLQMRVAKRLASLQRTHQNVFEPMEDFQKLLPRIAARHWAQGKGILLHLETRSIRPEGRINMFVDSLMTQIENPHLRKFLEARTKAVHRHVVSESHYKHQHFVESIHDYALAATGDPRIAEYFASYAAMIPTNDGGIITASQRIKRLQQELVEATEVVHDTQKTRGSFSEFVSKSNRQSVIASEKGYPTYFAPSKMGEPTGMYKSGDMTIQTAPGPIYLKSSIQMDPGIYWAPLRYLDYPEFMATAADKTKAAQALAEGLYYTVNFSRLVRNVGRASLAAANAFSTPLRQIAVGMGGVTLAGKHAVTDTSRTLLEEPGALRVYKYRKAREAVLSEADRESTRYVRFTRHLAENTELNYRYGEGRNIGWKAINLTDGTGTYGTAMREINIGRASDDLRRMADDPVFYQWAQAGGVVGQGRAAVEAWLRTKLGKQFLEAGGHVKRARTEAKMSGRKLKSGELYDTARNTYLDEIVDQVYGQMPEHVREGMIRFSLNGQTDKGTMKRFIRDLARDYPDENIKLSVPVQRRADMAATRPFQLGSQFGALPDRMNRLATFDYIFVKTHKHLKAQGIDANIAARTAAETAYLRTQQLHFDLSRGYQFEMKYRALAWFMTDQRLWSTWIARTAIQRPQIAAAVDRFDRVMQERNEEIGVPSYKKHDVAIPIGGGDHFMISPSSQMWLVDFTQESTIGHLVHRGVAMGANEVLGTDYKAPQSPFGLPITRIDEYVELAAMTWLHPNYPEDGSPQAIRKYYESLSDIQREKIDKTARAIAQLERHKGNAITPEQAINRAVGSMWSRMGLKLVKAPATGIWTKEQSELVKQQQEFEALDAGQPRWDYLKEHEALRFGWGFTGNFIDDQELLDCILQYETIEGLAADEILQLQSVNKLIDKESVNGVFNRRQVRVDNLKYDHPVFAKWYEVTEMENVQEMFGIFFDAAIPDAREYINQNRGRTEADEKEQEAKLTREYQEVLANYGMTATDGQNTVLGKMLKHDNVTRPFIKWLGYDPKGGVGYQERSVAKYLARGPGGEQAKADYLNLLADKRLAEMAGKGVRDGRGQKSMPFMATLTQEEKWELGWNSSQETRDMWFYWATKQWYIKRYQRENGISPTSKAGKAQWEGFEAWTVDEAQKNKEWGAEMWFSREPLHERLDRIGVVGPGSEFSSQWREFLDIVSDFHDELDNTPNPTLNKLGVGPRAQAAHAATEKHLARIAQLARENEVWWSEFRNTFTISKFGFYWRTESELDDFLLWGATSMPGGPFDAGDWWSLAQEESEYWSGY